MEDNCQLAILIFGTGLAICGALFGAILQSQYTTHRMVDKFSVIHTENGYYKLNKSTLILDRPKVPEYEKIEEWKLVEGKRLSSHTNYNCGRSVASTKKINFEIQ